jgi:hypothetical protein
LFFDFFPHFISRAAAADLSISSSTSSVLPLQVHLGIFTQSGQALICGALFSPLLVSAAPTRHVLSVRCSPALSTVSCSAAVKHIFCLLIRGGSARYSARLSDFSAESRSPLIGAVERLGRVGSYFIINYAQLCLATGSCYYLAHLTLRLPSPSPPLRCFLCCCCCWCCCCSRTRLLV